MDNNEQNAGERIVRGVIGNIVRFAHRTARIKGWWGSVSTDIDVPISPTAETIATKLALIHSEVSEALECVRDDDLKLRADENGKPCGLPSELADVVIRVADLCGALGIDLAEAIGIKLAYNETRTHRHGGRRL